MPGIVVDNLGDIAIAHEPGNTAGTVDADVGVVEVDVGVEIEIAVGDVVGVGVGVDVAAGADDVEHAVGID